MRGGRLGILKWFFFLICRMITATADKNCVAHAVVRRVARSGGLIGAAAWHRCRRRRRHRYGVRACSCSRPSVAARRRTSRSQWVCARRRVSYLSSRTKTIVIPCCRRHVTFLFWILFFFFHPFQFLFLHRAFFAPGAVFRGSPCTSCRRLFLIAFQQRHHPFQSPSVRIVFSPTSWTLA